MGGSAAVNDDLLAIVDAAQSVVSDSFGAGIMATLLFVCALHASRASPFIGCVMAAGAGACGLAAFLPYL